MKSTEPEGSEAVPASVSVTVTVQVEASSIATGVSHSTLVEVVRSVTTMSSLSKLDLWMVEAAS